MLDKFTCKKCGIEKNLLEDFPKVKGNTSGFGHACKKCISEYQKAWRQEDREAKLARQRESTRLYASSEKGIQTALVKKANRYGISAEEYSTVMSSKGGKCHICSTRNSVHLDHCHTTGAVRGALCAQCNTGIGLLDDNVEKLLLAIRYLQGPITQW